MDDAQENRGCSTFKPMVVVALPNRNPQGFFRLHSVGFRILSLSLCAARRTLSNLRRWRADGQCVGYQLATFHTTGNIFLSWLCESLLQTEPTPTGLAYLFSGQFSQLLAVIWLPAYCLDKTELFLSGEVVLSRALALLGAWMLRTDESPDT